MPPSSLQVSSACCLVAAAHCCLAQPHAPQVRPATHGGEYGRMPILIESGSELYSAQADLKKPNVWMSHGDEAVRLPDGFQTVAKSEQVGWQRSLSAALVHKMSFWAGRLEALSVTQQACFAALHTSPHRCDTQLHNAMQGTASSHDSCMQPCTRLSGWCVCGLPAHIAAQLPCSWCSPPSCIGCHASRALLPVLCALCCSAGRDRGD